MTTIKTWDISGMGGGYEATCQRMLWAGVKFMKTLKNPKDLMLEANFAECQKAMYAVDGGSGCTGAMMGKVTGHLRFFSRNGYDKWFEALRAYREPEGPIDFELSDEE